MTQWIYHREENLYILGTPKFGCGVYEHGGIWSADIYINPIIVVGDFKTKKKAIKKAEESFNKLKETINATGNLRKY